MEKVVLTADETALVRYLGQKTAGPRHTLMLPADRETVATLSLLAEKGLAESTEFVQRTLMLATLRVPQRAESKECPLGPGDRI